MSDTITMRKPKCLNPEVIGFDAVLPKVDRIRCDYYWLELTEEIWSFDSTDSDPKMGDMGCLETVLYYKTKDFGYAELVDSLLTIGFVCPIQYHADRKFFGNGHHRLIAAIDNGFTHIPYVDSLNLTYISGYPDTEAGDHWDNLSM